ncbi:8-oxo-dGTP pyrophosphatase MutT (NUDIX family) [Nocardiopsis mwathae]|uniref:8-oxo-dGTP pyrophosphatase MutT (NUDIX family) n=1 Tax=Nocardiopsis mwathae TaxID=1472723 RepID=A0A7W9YKF2_9ACTN|nr:NUDIX domain-containing protein [Nocardiopsis mwathae]MBB6173803.1 8-oxo-dGTP pyrophosphatase MutT (NUDIX family) [Nocardiopsis mwathae]
MGTPVPSASPAPVIDAIAWVHVRDGRLLCARTHGRELFYLPGGKPEPGESPEAAVTREVEEEVSVALRPGTIRPFTVVDELADGYPEGTRVRLSCYVAEHDGDPVPTNEIAELAWLDSAGRSRCAPAVRRVIDELADRGLVG